MQGQADNQNKGHHCLNDQFGVTAGRGFGGLPSLKTLQHGSNPVGQLGAVAKASGHLQQQAGQQSHGQHRHGHRSHKQEKFQEIPAGDCRNQQILGFSDQGADAAQCRANGAVHHQAAQESAKIFQILVMVVVDAGVVAVVVVISPMVLA